MEKTNIMILVMVIILIGFVIFSFSVLSGFQIAGEVIKNSYTFTKAICDDANYCEDYEIECESGEIISLTPTGAVQFSDDWKDPRDEETRERVC